MRQRPPFYVYQLNQDKATDLVRFFSGNPNAVAEPMVAIMGENGLCTVCTEGVGWHKDENDKYTLLYKVGYESLWVDIDIHFLSDLLIEPTLVKLGDFIRVFGSRLENNFDIWYYYGKDYDQTLVLPIVDVHAGGIQ